MKQFGFARMLGACVIALLVGACAKGAPAVGPETGRITVGVTARGMARDLESMAFSVEIQPPGSRGLVPANGVYDEDVLPGEHLVRLRPLPANCRVSGPAERRVTVSVRRTTAVRFSVTCD